MTTHRRAALGQIISHGEHGGILHQSHHGWGGQYRHVTRTHPDSGDGIRDRQLTRMIQSYFNHIISRHEGEQRCRPTYSVFLLSN